MYKFNDLYYHLKKVEKKRVSSNKLIKIKKQENQHGRKETNSIEK